MQMGVVQVLRSQPLRQKLPVLAREVSRGIRRRRKGIDGTGSRTARIPPASGLQDLLQGRHAPMLEATRRLQRRRVQPALDGDAGPLSSDLAHRVEGHSGLDHEQQQRVRKWQDLLRGRRRGRPMRGVSIGRIQLQRAAFLICPLFRRVSQIVDEGDLARADDIVVAKQMAASRVNLRRQVHSCGELSALGDVLAEFPVPLGCKEIGQGSQRRGGGLPRCGIPAILQLPLLLLTVGGLLQPGCQVGRLEEAEEVRLLLCGVQLLQVFPHQAEALLAQKGPHHDVREGRR
mmetsp:Transcript_38395/g.123455  ORF Transcript_38395/g.123455 Transcript_38395/m.123455 type:complete len:289 (+) Transcript_38395:893-1759(+)